MGVDLNLGGAKVTFYAHDEKFLEVSPPSGIFLAMPLCGFEHEIGLDERCQVISIGEPSPSQRHLVFIFTDLDSFLSAGQIYFIPGFIVDFTLKTR